MTSSNEVFKDFESDMAVGIIKLGNLTRQTAGSNNTAKQTVGSLILTLLLQVKKPDL